MEVLREYSQLVNKTKAVLSYDISETPMLDKMGDADLEYIIASAWKWHKNHPKGYENND